MTTSETAAETAWAEAMKYENRHDPYPFFDRLRETPVVQVAEKTFVVTGYQELLTLIHDPRISSDLSRSPLAVQRAARGEAPPVASNLGAYGHDTSLIVSDPPDHDRARRQVMRHFGPPHSPDVIPNVEPDVQRHCNELLDRIKVRGEHRFDVVDDYAYPVPVAVICKILGVPLKDEPNFHGWIHDFMAGTDLGPDAQTEEGQVRVRRGRDSTAELAQYISGLIDGYLEKPGDGLLSKLVNDNDGPDGAMAPKEATANALLLLVAGHDSTVNTVSNCVMTLLRNPGSLELLCAEPELIPRAVEEVQRLQSAVQFFPSYSSTADIEIAGTVIPSGCAVHLLYGAANRDPARFTNPNQFDPQRSDNEHFGWGSGIHACMGGPLARLEVNIMLENFLRRVENPRLVVDPPPYRQSQIFRGPAHLWIDFDTILE
jgi:cytochrome P450